MERFITEIRAQLGVRRETALLATAALLEWLDDPAASSSYRLIDRALAAIGSPHRDDVSLAMALRHAGLTLDQVDRFVELFLAHFPAGVTEIPAPGVQHLERWLARKSPEGETVALPH